MSNVRSFPPDYLSADSAAYVLDISTSTFYALVRAKKLPQGVKIGGNVRWQRAALLGALEGISGGASSEADEVLEAARGAGSNGRH